MCSKNFPITKLEIQNGNYISTKQLIIFLYESRYFTGVVITYTPLVTGKN